jgi:hypothetical protein
MLKKLGPIKHSLCKLTKLEEFVQQALDKEPLLSDQQLIDRARDAGVSRSNDRERARQVRSSVSMKEEICKQLGISFDELEEIGRIRIPKVQREEEIHRENL